METSFLGAPHPYLKEPVLYVVDIPDRVKWNVLEKLLSSCGRVRSEGRTTLPGTNRKRLKVAFSSVFYAEMALATLSGVQIKGITPTFHMFLSHSPSLEVRLSRDPLLPLYVRDKGTELPMELNRDAQTIFTWFRQAGPLVSVRCNADIGYDTLACTVQYWQEEHLKFAKKMGPAIHKAARDLKFTLQPYDAWNLYCARLGRTVTEETFRQEANKHGQVLESHLVRPGQKDTFGFVSYNTQDAALKARRAMDGRKIGEREVLVRYHEPKAADKVRPHKGSIATRSEFSLAKSGITKRAAASDAKANVSTQHSKTAQQPQPQRQAAHDDKRSQQALSEATAKRVSAEALEMAARRVKEKALLEEEAKTTAFAQAEEKEKEAQDVFETAKDAFEAAKLAFDAAKTCLADATTQVQFAFADLCQATHDSKEAQSEEDEARRVAELARQTERKLQEPANSPKGDDTSLHEDGIGAEDREEEPFDPRTEADRRSAELEESRRKMEELRKQEEADRLARKAKAHENELQESLRKMAEFEAEERRRKKEKAEAEVRAREAAKRAKEERERKEREEAERKAREQREKEERERKEAAERQERYNLATLEEISRCRRRDEARWTSYLPWTATRSIDRFRAVSKEFDGIKFGPKQPLTFDSIPWPTLHSPYKIKFDDIDWQAVESFFEKLQLATDEDEYRTIVEKAHRRFHPDKWRSRGLLNTILDDSIRDQIENAGNIVAQALTPIWLRSRRSK